jgi:hypothetical protein
MKELLYIGSHPTAAWRILPRPIGTIAGSTLLAFELIIAGKFMEVVQDLQSVIEKMPAIYRKSSNGSLAYPSQANRTNHPAGALSHTPLISLFMEVVQDLQSVIEKMPAIF